MDDDWEPRPSLLRRLMVPTGATERPSAVALVLGLAAAGSFGASLVFRWVEVTMTFPRNGGDGISPGETVTTDVSLSNVDTLSLVYLVGVIGLLGLLGAVLTKPDIAVRVRMTTVGVGVGLAAIVVATVLRMPESIYGINVSFFGGADFAQALDESAKIAYQPGLFSAAATIVFLVAGLWVAGRPAVRPAPKPVEAGSLQPYVPESAPSPNGATPVAPSRLDRLPGPVGRVDELTVFASEPLDPNVNPEIWRG